MYRVKLRGRPRGRIARQWLYRVKLRGKTKRKDSKAVVV